MGKLGEKEQIYSSSVKYVGIFSFRDFYKFCYEWLTEDTSMDFIMESKYEEKIKGDEKEVVVEWEGEKKITDYFRFDIKVKFEIKALKNVEVMQDGVKVKTNSGSAKIGVKGTLVRDYQGKFASSAFRKFMGSIYEKWVIPSRIKQFEDYVAEKCDEFLGQAKAYLDLEGKR